MFASKEDDIPGDSIQGDLTYPFGDEAGKDRGHLSNVSASVV